MKLFRLLLLTVMLRIWLNVPGEGEFSGILLNAGLCCVTVRLDDGKIEQYGKDRIVKTRWVDVEADKWGN